MLPELMRKQDAVTMQNTFLGVNLNLQPSDQEFADMKNMTNDYFPVLGNRRKYNIGSDLLDCKALCGGEFLAYIAKNASTGRYVLNYAEQDICEVSGDPYSQIVIMGAYICVFPDGIVYNTNTEETEHIKNTVNSTSTQFVLSKIDGTELNSSNTVSQATEPTDKTKYWIDTSQKTVVVKMYSEAYGMWTSVGTTYVKIKSRSEAMKNFKKYDAVTLSGANNQSSWTYNNYDFNTTLPVYDVGEENGWYYIVVTGLINKAHTQSDPIKIERKMPNIDFVCEQDNRLYACSTKDHEIYASAQGNPCNWYRYMGLDDDSYAATVGSQGSFTGCISYGGYVYFFKEDGFHKLYGNKPSNFEMVWKPAKGIQLGSEKSLAGAGDYFFYKSKEGVVMFDGSVNMISGSLGFDKYYDAVGGCYRGKYYISMRDADYNYRTYIYDSSKGTWNIDDIGRCQAMAETTKNGLYIVKYRDESSISEVILVNDELLYTTIFPLGINLREAHPLAQHQEEILADLLANPLSVGDELDAFYLAEANKFGTTVPQLQAYILSKNWFPTAEDSIDKFYPMYTQTSLTREEEVEWAFETGDMGMDSPFQKYIKRVYLRLWLDLNTNFIVYVMYDSSDSWERMMEYRATRKRSYDIPLVIKRCDHFRLRFEGSGDVRLYSIAKAMEGGSGDGNI